LGLLLSRTALNLALTIATFGVLTANIAILHKAQAIKGYPYTHDCNSEGSYSHLLVHGLYYHTVIFQSLGDGGHAPMTLPAQMLATIESYLAMTYLALLLGGSLSVAIFVESALTEEVIHQELIRSVLPIWTRRVPITKPEDPRISTT